jgi:serine protease AprX
MARGDHATLVRRVWSLGRDQARSRDSLVRSAPQQGSWSSCAERVRVQWVGEHVKSKYAVWAAAVAVQVAAVPALGAVVSPAEAATVSPAPGSRVLAPVADAIGSALWGDVPAGQAAGALTASGAYAPARDSGSLYNLEASQGIHDLWASGVTGKGVTVAVIDTGIAPVEGLETNVVNGPDLSLDAQVGLPAHVDAFGHGTHMAGIIAGKDAGWNRRSPSPSSFAGVAPDATLLNVKVGASDGGADVSQVIAALDWVTQHRTDRGLDVRVVSLAYGTTSVQPWQVDPLAHAVESAWRAGIVVVAAAGNDGLDAPSLLMPAVDPRVIAVGASDQRGTDTLSDDTVADFSSGGSSSRRPDVVAPGRSIVSLRVPGSYVDTMSPEGRVEGDASGRWFRGSGTSQSTAFVAGQVALLLSARPGLTPDQVKVLLTDTARPLADKPAQSTSLLRSAVTALGQVTSALSGSGRSTDSPQGAGMTNIRAAVRGLVLRSAPSLPWSSGTGSLELARGGEHLVDPATGAVLSGEVDVLGIPWDAQRWSTASTAGSSWSGGDWNARTWTGSSPTTGGWGVVLWTGDSWGGRPWSSYLQNDVQWLSRSWRGGSWESRSWREDSWRSRSWRSLYSTSS